MASSPASALPNETVWWLDPTWQVFSGHFPAHPVLPGACLLDWVAQTLTAGHGHATWRCPQVKFPGAALPGDWLRLRWVPGARRGISFTVERFGQGTSAHECHALDAQEPRIVANGLMVLADA